MRVAVIGSGVQGLVAALRLAQGGARVDVLERWPWLGGRAAAFDLGGGVLAERLPAPFAPGDTHALALCEELGLTDVTWEPAVTAVLLDGRAWEAWKGVKPVPRAERRRLERAADALGRGEEEATGDAAAWAHVTIGAGAWEQVLGPLLRARFGTDAVPAALAARLLGAPPLVGHLAGTSAALVGALQRAVEALGGRVLPDRPAARMRPDDDGSLLVSAGAPGSWRRGRDPREYDPDGSPERYDAVVAAVAGEVLVDLCDQPLVDRLGEPLLDRLEIPAPRVTVVLALQLDHALTRAWRTLVADEGVPFAEVRERAAAGAHLVHALAERDVADPLTALDAEHLLTAFVGGLRTVEPGFAPGWVVEARVHREPVPDRAVTPVPVLTPVPGLVVAHGDLRGEPWSIDAMVRLGEQAAAAI